MMAEGSTLPNLLSISQQSVERAYVAEGAGRADMPALDLWANLLRVLDEDGVDRTQLPTLSRLSKRAVRTRVLTAVRRDWVEEIKSSGTQARVRLTQAGSTVAKRWGPLERTAEGRWRARVGAERADALRAALERLIGSLALEHPHYPASYGAADASITGGGGQDWKAVPRTGDSASGLSLSALLSQAIVAFAMCYEETSPVALTLSANVIVKIPPGGRPLKGLGESVGVSALARHGYVRLSIDRVTETIHLTDKGEEVRGAHDERTTAVETRWRAEFGDEKVATLRRALEDVVNNA